MRYTLILASLFALSLATGASSDSHADTPNDETSPTVCPDTHYECGVGICCPKE